MNKKKTRLPKGYDENFRNKKEVNMDKSSYKVMISDLMLENSKLKKENQNLRDVLLSLRNEYINQGGDPNQLEIFDVNHGTQLKIFESPDGGKTIYEREAGDYENMRKKISE